MKTLIINGSARKNGDTHSMIQELIKQLEGEYFILQAHSCNIHACVDCRYCWEHPQCCVQDGWQELDAYLRECDNVVIASPIYFCEITGPVLSVLSRLQGLLGCKNIPLRKAADKAKTRRNDSAGRGQGNGNRSDEYSGGVAKADECQRDF